MDSIAPIDERSIPMKHINLCIDPICLDKSGKVRPL